MANEKLAETGQTAAPMTQHAAAPVLAFASRSSASLALPNLVAFPAAANHAQTDFRYVAPTADFPLTSEATATFDVPASTSAWDRLKEFRSRGNVQVLTLWKSPRFMLSLQSGRNGTAALQWSSQSMNRGAAKRGLLDGMLHHAEEPSQ